MARQLLTTLLLLAITFTTTLATFIPQQTSLPLAQSPNPLSPRSNYGCTLFAKGDNLPTTAAAACGLVLVVNDAPGRGVGMGLAAGIAALNGLAAVLGWMGLL
ncbi:unnamed protein product [Aureobasidium pullulans]|nr:unnamed protein product [Aureobasidium pullulans]